MNKYSLLAIGYGCGALTALLLAFQIKQPVLIGSVFALGGLYVGIEETVEDAVAPDLLPQDIRGTGFGSLAVANGIGDSISSLMVGWLWTAFNPAAGFGFAFLLMAAGTSLIAGMRRSL